MAILLALAAAAGGICRVALDARIPHGIMVVNAAGSFLLGLLYAFPPEVFLVLGVGFCGAFTTFSTTTMDAIALLRDRRYLAAAALTFGTLALCLTACAAGLLIHSP
ncbi:CrcB protein [Bowdeniella nasicola]|uniref:Fluoride-specific ion channel FluC n=1 Tax=Bowdeniella nasicola TaxID=208480 RepID=A0A1H3XY15_9ACTO|nr:CrcB family protein [Bowdeniella nasicola]SEA04276.1 CrcB protein [Bowdeniella nasicola]